MEATYLRRYSPLNDFSLENKTLPICMPAMTDNWHSSIVYCTYAFSFTNSLVTICIGSVVVNKSAKFTDIIRTSYMKLFEYLRHFDLNIWIYIYIYIHLHILITILACRLRWFNFINFSFMQSDTWSFLSYVKTASEIKFQGNLELGTSVPLTGESYLKLNMNRYILSHSMISNALFEF